MNMPATEIRPNTKGHLPALDGLRGIAILLVLFHHLWPWIWHNPVLAGITRLSHISWMGVDLFFVLSGFLISGILIDSRTEPGYLKNFFARRTLRIFPLFYLFLMICFFLLPSTLSELDYTAREAINPAWFWLYGTNYIWSVQPFNPPEYLGITWSLAVEEQFYLIWPIVVLILTRNLKWAIACGIVIALLARILLILSVERWADATYMASISRLDSLLIGAGVALYLRSGNFNQQTWMRVTRIFFFGCLPAVIAWQLITPGRATISFSAAGYTLLGLGMAGVMMLVISDPNKGIGRLMSLAVLRWFGRYSYGIYLYHMLIWYLSHQWINAELKADGQPLHPEKYAPLADSILVDAVIRLSLCTALTLALAWISFHLYEKQFLKLKRYF